MSTTEQRIAEALSAFSGGITMDTSTMDKRFTEVRERGVQDRRRRREMAVGAAALAAAAALLAAFTLGGGLFGGDDRALPDVAEGPRFEGAQPASGEGFPLEGETYSVVPPEFPVPFAFTVPAKGDLPGKWHYGTGPVFGINLDDSPSTGHAMVEVLSLTETYDSSSPWFEQTSLTAAPVDAEGWVAWIEASGKAKVTAREELDIDGVPATRLVIDAEGLPRHPFQGGAVLAMQPIGDGTVGDGIQAGIPEDLYVEMTVFETEGRPLLTLTSGAPDTRDAWLPVMRSIVDSLQLD